jgi:haloalkane dehalogenase
MKKQRAPWLDRNEYPFESKYFELPMGKMHFIDEGEGTPFVFVHGNPGWSFEFRDVVKELSKTHRCIANDHIGFGLSDKPSEWNYLPVNHAENFKKFISNLHLDKLILIVNDWGGPIGLSYAVENPEKLKYVVITNTWMWSVKNDPYYRLFSGFVGGSIGRFLIRNFNFFGRVIIKKCIVDNSHFHPTIYRHLETKNDRKGCWTFPKQIIASSDWIDSVWQRRNNLTGIPKTIIWGMKDIAFREKKLNIWIEEFPDAQVIKLDNVGHYPHEEATDVFIAELRKLSTERTM